MLMDLKFAFKTACCQVSSHWILEFFKNQLCFRRIHIMEFSLNGTDSYSLNSGNLINRWSLNFNQLILYFYSYPIDQFVNSNTKKKPIELPVFTLSPICSSDIATDFPFSRVTLLVDGKHPSLEDSELSILRFSCSDVRISEIPSNDVIISFKTRCAWSHWLKPPGFLVDYLIVGHSTSWLSCVSALSSSTVNIVIRVFP